MTTSESGKASKKKFSVKYLIMGILFLAGLGVFLYPTVSNLYNEYRNSKLITSYDRTVSTLSADVYEDILAAARAYNDQHTVNRIVDAFEDGDDYVLTHPYDTLLNPNGDEIMGYIVIPKIDVRLAIYHGIGADVLEKGVGHIEGTSLPIGGAGTHAALSAHRGLPSALLFTDLDQMEAGDMFYLRILGDVLAYEVDMINTVLPNETDLLAIEEGQDLVTLITCTPYGVNSHRLLVRGHRVPYEEESKEAAEIEETVARDETALAIRLLKIGLIFLAIFLLGLLIDHWLHRKKKDKTGKEEKGDETEHSSENSS